MMNHSSRGSAEKFPRVLGAAIALWVWMAGSLGANAQQAPPLARIDLDQAIQLAIQHNHALKAAENTVQQSEADEITAAIRPNPVFTYDDLYVPVFSPSQLNATTLNTITEFDLGFSYTFERGTSVRPALTPRRDVTAVTRSQVKDNERTLTFNVAQQFVNVLLAKSNLDLANQDLASFQQDGRPQSNPVPGRSDQRRRPAENQAAVAAISDRCLARPSWRWCSPYLALRQLLGFESVPADYDVIGDLAYAPLHGNQEDLQSLALKQRPDLLAAQLGVTASQSQYQLAKANRARSVTTTFDYTHVSALNSAGFTVNMEIPIYDRNQGEIARTHYAITQANELQSAATETVMTDVANAFQAMKVNDQIVQLYTSGYLQQAQDSRDISEYAYKRGAASLLDFLDAERSYRATQLAYRQALANYMLAVEQLREAVGTRNLP